MPRDKGDLNMWWSYRKAKEYWVMIYVEFKKMFRFTFPKKPDAFLLGLTRVLSLFLYATTVARILYAQKWKGEEITTMEQ